MTVEYLTLDPANVTVAGGPTYSKIRFLYQDGEGRIIDRDRILMSAAGPLIHSADQEWTLEGWTIVRGSGCNCGGS